LEYSHSFFVDEINYFHKIVNSLYQRYMENLFGNRLKSARRMAGWSLQDLSDSMDNKISKQAISKYEKGIMMPDSEVLIALSKALKVKPDYFFRPFEIELEKVDFRKKCALSQKEIASINEKSRDFLERYLEIEQHLGIEQKFENPICEITINSPQDIEAATLKLRKDWNLGLDPLTNVFETLENKGFKIFEIKASESFDGMSSIVGGTLPILVINDIEDVVRRRFTILHELGHVLMQFPKDSTKQQIVRYCNTFAASFLLPQQALVLALGAKRHSIVLNELIDIKEQYGISLQALVFRAKELNIISAESAKRFWIFIKGTQESIKEVGLGQYRGKEKSERFNHLLYRAYAEQIISRSKLAELANTPLQQLEENLRLL